MDELAIQREGYAQAIQSKEFLQALKLGPNGRIAVTYFEWAASSDQKIIIPWRLVDGPETADAVAAEIMKKVLESAVANAEHNEGADVDDLKVSTVFVNEGRSLKRIMPRAKGRADRIVKRSCHITVKVADK